MAKHRKAEAMEITTFRLATGLTVDDFVATNSDINEWLVRQPGFRSRRVAGTDDGSIVDVLIWDSVADGADAAEQIMTEMSHSRVHAAIDHRTVIWSIAQVRLRTERAS